MSSEKHEREACGRYRHAWCLAAAQPNMLILQFAAMQLPTVALALVLCLAGSAAANGWWTNSVVSWWYSPDNNWPLMIEQVCFLVSSSQVTITTTTAHTPSRQVSAHPTVTTSVMVYCGAEVNDNGTVSLATSSLCVDESGSRKQPAQLARKLLVVCA